MVVLVIGMVVLAFNPKGKNPIKKGMSYFWKYLEVIIVMMIGLFLVFLAIMAMIYFALTIPNVVGILMVIAMLVVGPISAGQARRRGAPARCRDAL